MSMGKHAASAIVESSTLTFGDLKSAIRKAREVNGFSVVNPQFTLEQACDIYERAIKDRPDDEVIRPFRRDIYRDRDVRTKDSMIAQNIVRDCFEKSP